MLLFFHNPWAGPVCLFDAGPFWSKKLPEKTPHSHPLDKQWWYLENHTTKYYKIHLNQSKSTNQFEFQMSLANPPPLDDEV